MSPEEESKLEQDRWIPSFQPIGLSVRPLNPLLQRALAQATGFPTEPVQRAGAHAENPTGFLGRRPE